MALATGATFKEINKATFRKLSIIVPAQNVEHEFTEIVTPLLRQVANIQAQIKNLRITRDHLLPKLISGEANVEQLDIEVPGQ